MSDNESDTENIIPLTTHDDIIDIDIQLDTSNVSNEKYRTDGLEQLLKTSTDSKQYTIVKNSSQFIKSDVWSTFGFPGKLQTSGQYRIIAGFVSCFNCYKTLSYDGSTKYMNRHKCLHLNAQIGIEKSVCQSTIDKYMGKKAVIQKHDKEKIKEKLVLWSCSSIRPFTIVEDPGFIDIVKEAINLGELNFS
jgi:hypothetical protein